MKKSVHPRPARARRAKAAPAAKRVGVSLVTTLARQLQSFATSVQGNIGTATDVAFTLAQSRIHRPGTKAAVAKGAALLRDLRQAAGLADAAFATALAFRSQGRRVCSEAPARRKAR